MASTIKRMYIAVDFDGTLTDGGDQFPKCGKPNPHAISVIKKFKKDGHVVILNTCRRDEPLKAAIQWMKDYDIEPAAVDDNPWSRALYNDPTPGHKVFADVYIDDRSLGIKKTKSGSVDWKWIDKNYKKFFC